MSALTELKAKSPPPTYPPDELLISEDGVNLESDWHRIEIGLLVELCGQHLLGRTDYFAGGNMFIYFDEQHARDRNFRGPDFFFVWGPSPMPLRPYWAVWKEGMRFPNLIIELLSPTTEDMDRTKKKDVYERIFKTPEYYLYDPDTKQLEGWRLEDRVYQPSVPDSTGRLWSQQLELWLGLWDGWYLNRETTWLRFYTKDGILVPTIEEAAKRQIAAVQKRSATAEQKAATAEQKAATAAQQADEQRRRADAAEAELARLKARLEPKKD